MPAPPKKKETRKPGPPAVQGPRAAPRGQVEPADRHRVAPHRRGGSASLSIYRFVSDRDIGRGACALGQAARRRGDGWRGSWTPLRDCIEKYILAKGRLRGRARHGRGEVVERAGAARPVPAPAPGRREERGLIPPGRGGNPARDAFTGCMLKTENTALARGEPGRSGLPGPTVEPCQATPRRRTPGVGREVKDASNLLLLRVFEQQYDKAERDDIPW